MTDFVEKYKPTVPTDIIGNVKQIGQIQWWLNNYESNREVFYSQPKKKKKAKIIIKTEEGETDGVENTETYIPPVEDQKTFSKKKGDESQHSCLMITGEHGVGKTCTVLAILNELKYNVTTIDLSKLGSNKGVLENVNKLTIGSNIYDKLNGDKTVKKVVVLDEIESANSPVEKNYITQLLKKNEENWFFPIIFISNGKHTQLNSTLKTYSCNVQFNQPTQLELMTLLSKIATKEKMSFDSLEVGHTLVSHAQNDFRRLVSIIQDLRSMYGKKKISFIEINEYCTLSKKKDTNIEIFRATMQMMLRYKGIDNCLKMYEKEKVILPLVMHQNYIKTIVQNHFQGNKKFKLINDISRSIAFGDLVENYIYSDQNWDMQEVHGFLTCSEPAFKIFSEKINANEEYLRRSFDFPFDLNRTSIKKINKKNIINSNTCLKNLEIKDFIFANRLIRQLIADEKVDECAALFEGYGAKVENIESILKIDKINETKTVLPTQVKKRLLQILGSKK